MREFSNDQCTDLRCFDVLRGLGVVPPAIALLSLVSLVGQGPKTVDTLLGILSDVGASNVAATLQAPWEQLSRTPGVGIALVAELLGALWSASGTSERSGGR